MVIYKGSTMDDMGDMEMDMESMMGGGDGVKTGDGPNLQVVVLSNIEQSCLALQQMGMILSELCFIQGELEGERTSPTCPASCE